MDTNLMLCATTRRRGVPQAEALARAISTKFALKASQAKRNMKCAAQPLSKLSRRCS
jgi:hypothetical protein